jgi:hypothetical protein
MQARMPGPYGNNSPFIENNFEMFVRRTTGQQRVCKAMVLASLRGATIIIAIQLA